MNEPKVCECGCGEQTNVLDIQARSLYTAGLSLREVADRMGIKKGYAKHLLHREEPRYKRGHSGRVVHVFGQYRNCRLCGRRFYAYHGETVCRNSDQCALTISIDERRSLRTGFQQARQELIARHIEERAALTQRRKEVLRSYHNGGGVKMSRHQRKLDKEAQKLLQRQERELRDLGDQRVSGLTEQWETRYSVLNQVRSQSHPEIWNVDNDWRESGGYMAELNA